jgi:uncharacterized membrane protein (DUF2068 family)
MIEPTPSEWVAAFMIAFGIIALIAAVTMGLHKHDRKDKDL